ncbi:putative Type-3 glutamine synthetase [Blattamonas nauphoetae]|uniref:Type-3 glutamine synthetase n=1 Tax=Blattamonas nauphoetae TaxID=2049346 RepID=A0ABQ9XIN8_9EUKA|nr:putative Type-3 glutamine synthetase [Blattamonas nauphoetae]
MNLTTLFGSRVFGDAAMQKYLPLPIYESLKNTNRLGKPLDPKIADTVAQGMKEWALSLGATHYSHWFLPLSNMSAGKHDSFIDLCSDGTVVTSFSSSALVQGEPDASSFPSGGLRATFEARGYTAWDPTSPAFVKDRTLYIPTAFYSYTGEALDTKTPLLRSMQALNPQALRILHRLGIDDAQFVSATVGAEQEYFLIDRKLADERLDLKLCGRTLIGAKPPKGQQLDDYYCGRIRLRIAAFMHDLDEQLWSYGVSSKTKHNEAAPAQHELAPIFETVNIACDHNLLTMEVLRETAKRHGITCLLHEKPFAGINGSGKHNNYSISTDTGINFLSPGKNPEKNHLFLLSVCAIIDSVDNYADLLRLSAITPGNEHRLGGGEAPPDIISMFLGEKLTQMLHDVAQGISGASMDKGVLNTGVAILPHLAKDDSDRNRTSPFAFTGNKFEFRMLGSSQSIGLCNTVLNTAVADAFSRFADRLERCPDEKLEEEIVGIVFDTLKEHGRIIYNGNNYSQDWRDEAARRGLPILTNSPDTIDTLCLEKNVELFEKYKIFTAKECQARKEIMHEYFCKVLLIEADTLLHMIKRQVFPAGLSYLQEVSRDLAPLSSLGLKSGQTHAESLAVLVDKVFERCALLENVLTDVHAAIAMNGQSAVSVPYKVRDSLVPAMASLREACDALEVIMPSSRWPMPTYTDLLLDDCWGNDFSSSNQHRYSQTYYIFRKRA